MKNQRFRIVHVLDAPHIVSNYGYCTLWVSVVMTRQPPRAMVNIYTLLLKMAIEIVDLPEFTH
jgi:hypothetical protein